jgi:rSAM/selenodomain-associated transferase 1
VSTRLIVFARAPVLGRVKTRLAASIGAERALAVHQRLFATTVAIAESAVADRLELRLHADDPAVLAATAAPLAARGWRVAPQRGRDLGDRMHEALAGALADGDRPVLIGSDCPSLRADDLRAAFDALRDHEAVFAPAEDGGYALVGIARPLPSLFEAMPWGTPEVMAVTRARTTAQGLRIALLRTVWDVDVEADLNRWDAEPSAN